MQPKEKKTLNKNVNNTDDACAAVLSVCFSRVLMAVATTRSHNQDRDVIVDFTRRESLWDGSSHNG